MKYRVILVVCLGMFDFAGGTGIQASTAFNAPSVTEMGSANTVSIVPQASQHVLGDGRLRAIFDNNGHGVLLSSFTRNGNELLNGAAESEIFTLFLKNLDNGQEIALSASQGWGKVRITGDTTHASIELERPLSSDLPSTLKAIVTVSVSGEHSRWDLSVSGLGNTTLNQVYVPQLNIHSDGNDHFLLPRYSGILIDDPVASNVNWEQLYPAGWHASMQFLAYYGSEYGLYFGFHDPLASTKRFHVAADHGGIVVEGRYVIPDNTIAGNDWDMPGVLELDLFEGDWFDAAERYKAWVSSEALYWPQDSKARKARLKAIGNIALWATSGSGNAPAAIEPHVLDFARYMGVPVGLTWYKWNYKDFDTDYPEYFPEQDGMDVTVAHLQSTNITVVPYINGRMFDMALDGSGPSGLSFDHHGLPYATKDALQNVFTQTFNGNLFAVMCPTQAPWQDILIDAANKLMQTIGAAGIYIDQVGAASPVGCMDTTHKHVLGGGAWWTGGYRQMFQRVHSVVPDGRFVTTENGADNLLGELDGLMVQGWQADNMVPAFQAVYSGKVMLFGMKTGVSQYNQQQFYAKLAQAFAHGIQLGRFYTSIQNETGDTEMAPLFIRKLGRLRHKLAAFFSYGSMKRPLVLAGIPAITSTWQHTYDGDIPVTIPAIQTSTWFSDIYGVKKIMVVFVNASMQDSVSFNFELDPRKYGLEGPLYLQRISDTSDSEVLPLAATASKSLVLEARDATAFVISTSPLSLGDLVFADDFED